jgi:cobalt-zinc-cadmium efflux system membrane fusion protein
VQVVTVEPTPLRRVLRLPGTVAYNGFETTPVITQISGSVSRILISPGKNVRASQPMLYVASPDFAQAAVLRQGKSLLGLEIYIRA